MCLYIKTYFSLPCVCVCVCFKKKKFELGRDEPEKNILYQMISHHSYQNPINKRYVYKNNYPLIHVFHLLVGYLFDTR